MPGNPAFPFWRVHTGWLWFAGHASGNSAPPAESFNIFKETKGLLSLCSQDCAYIVLRNYDSRRLHPSQSELTETLRGELKGSLLGVLDQTVHPWESDASANGFSSAIAGVDRIRKRQDGVAYFVSHSMLRAELQAALKPLSDLETSYKPHSDAGHANRRDLVANAGNLLRLPAVEKVIKERRR